MIKQILILALAFSTDTHSAPASVPVLAYHRVSPDTVMPSETDIQITRFEEHMRMIKDRGYTTLNVTELADLLRDRRPLPPRAVVLTFDDGWKSNLLAQQVLEKYSHKGTFYIVSGFIGTPIYLTKAELRYLAAKPNVEIGAHTHTHFLPWPTMLTAMDSDSVTGEMRLSKNLIEDIIAKPVSTFAWPFGHIFVVPRGKAASIGFTSVVEVNRYSLNKHGTPPHAIQRLNVDCNCTADQVQRMIETGVFDKCK